MKYDRFRKVLPIWYIILIIYSIILSKFVEFGSTDWLILMIVFTIIGGSGIVYYEIKFVLPLINVNPQ